jgi:hypothetical protein
MKLLTHNMLASNVPGVKDGYPLELTVTKTSTEESERNLAFLISMLPKLNYPALLKGAASVRARDCPCVFSSSLPPTSDFPLVSSMRRICDAVLLCTCLSANHAAQLHIHARSSFMSTLRSLAILVYHF